MFKASAPGSLMLLGEYAVLHGKHALVCAVDKRITVTVVPRDDTQIEITSSMLGNFTIELSRLLIVPPFQFVLAALKRYQKKLPSGCLIMIESDFSDKIGFGSSAAVTVAMVAALSAWLQLSFSPEDMILEARKIIRQVQGLGSGADVAACVLGGMVAYRMRPFVAEKLAHDVALTAIYSGYKTPTAEAVTRVKTFFSGYPKLFKQLCEVINNCALEGIQSVRDQRWTRLGEVMNIQQGLMESLGVSTTLLQDIISELRQQKNILGAKISGSGLGDCVVGLGSSLDSCSTTLTDQGVRLIPVKLSLEGVLCEKI